MLNEPPKNKLLLLIVSLLGVFKHLPKIPSPTRIINFIKGLPSNTKTLYKNQRAEIKDKGFKQYYCDTTYKYLLFMHQYNPRWKLSFIYGAIGGLAMSPFHFFFVLPVVFTSIIRITDFCDTLKKALISGFAFCFGFYLVSFYWVSFAMLSSVKYFILLPVVILIIPGILAVFGTAVFYVYYKFFIKAPPLERTIVFALLWATVEFIRGYILIPFPWNFLGYSLGFSLSAMQIVAYTGIYGASVFISVMCCSFHVLLLTGDGVTYIKYVKFVSCMVLTFILVIISGYVRLASNPTQSYDSRLMIVQNNNKPITHWTKEKADTIFNGYLATTANKNSDDLKYIFWPEGSIPVAYFGDNALYVDSQIDTILGDEQILFGSTTRYDPLENKVFNSMIIRSGLQTQYYDKKKLVMFGEYIPFKQTINTFLPFLKVLTGSGKNFSAGEEFKVMSTPNDILTFMPMICFDAGFSGSYYRSIIHRMIGIKPDFIVHSTNDSWFKFSSGPFQHLMISRFRAIEFGSPVIRSASTGISAIIDPLGRIVSKTKLGKKEILTGVMPKALNKKTLFTSTGNILSLLIVVTLMTVFSIRYAYPQWKSTRPKKPNNNQN